MERPSEIQRDKVVIAAYLGVDEETVFVAA